MRFYRIMAFALAMFVGTGLGNSPPRAAGQEDFEIFGLKPSNLEVGLSKTIFLDLRDINVVDVIKFLASEGSINIVTSKNVQGRATLLLHQVSIRDALDIIVLSNQLAYETKNGIIYVMTEEEYLQLYGKNFNDQREILIRMLQYAKPDYVVSALQSIISSVGKVIIDEDSGTIVMIDTRQKLEEMDALVDQLERKVETRVVTLQYADATEVATALKAKLEGRKVGTIDADPRTNQLMVNAYPGRMQEILPMIDQLDRKTKVVMVNARILQVTINPKFDYGIDWRKALVKEDTWYSRSLKMIGSFPIDSQLSTAGTVGIFQLGDQDDEDFVAEIKNLKQVSKTNVLATPRLMIINRQEAKINIGDTIPYVVTTTTGTGNNVSISEEIKFINVGISLAVTPIINDDGYITMRIRPEISSRTGTLTTPAKAQIPLVNTTFIESSVMVKDGVTIILGGLRRRDLSEDTKGVPYAMDIPILGHLFKNRKESAQNTEIVIFLTPKIISGAVNETGMPLAIKPMKA